MSVKYHEHSGLNWRPSGRACYFGHHPLQHCFFCVCVIEEFLIGSIVMLTLIDFIMRSVGVSGSRKSMI